MIVMGRGNHAMPLQALPPGTLGISAAHGFDNFPGSDHADGRGPQMSQYMGGGYMGDGPIMERVLIVDDHPLVRDGLR